MALSPSSFFTQYPLTMHPETKAIEAPSSSSSDALKTHLDTLNALHRALKSVPSGIPPPPIPVPPQRSAAIEKMRNAGNGAFRAGKFQEAVGLYTHALSMALTRPSWESAQLMKEELQALFLNRSQAYMSMSSWPEALADAECAVDFRGQQSIKAYWRKGKALKEMGRLEEAKEALEFGVEVTGDQELVTLLKEVRGLIEARK